MKRVLPIVSAVIFTASLLYGAWVAVDYRTEAIRLRGEIEKILAEMSTGGAEVTVPDPPPMVPGEYLFPIREHDYMMLTSPFGWRVSPVLHVERDHIGIDISAVERAQVVAIADGVVIHHYLKPGTPHPDGGFYRGHDVYGCMVHIRHDDGVESLYAHLSESFVREGQFVRAGKPIGRIGNTGMSVKEHLHFEIISGGERQNPLHYVRPLDISGREGDEK